jgi:hypothetical protein
MLLDPRADYRDLEAEANAQQGKQGNVPFGVSLEERDAGRIHAPSNPE